MQVAVFGRNVEVTAALREYVEKKLKRLDKYIQAPLGAQVTLEVERGRHIVEVTVPMNGLLLRGEEATSDMYASVDLVVDKLEKQVVKYKTRFTRRKAAAAAASAAPAPSETEPVAAEDSDRVVKVKRFALKPQSVEEAILQMNLLGHDFYVFTNAETQDVNVVYRRHDGDYGLIEPER